MLKRFLQAAVTSFQKLANGTKELLMESERRDPSDRRQDERRLRAESIDSERRADARREDLRRSGPRRDG